MHVPLGALYPAFPAPLNTITCALRRAAAMTQNLYRGREDPFWETADEVCGAPHPNTPTFVGQGKSGITPEPWETDAAGDDKGMEGSWEVVGAGESKGGEDWRLLHYEGGELGWCDQGGITTRVLEDGEDGLEGEEAWEEVYIVPFYDWYGDEDDEDVTPAIWGAGCGCKLCMEVPVWVESPAWRRGEKKDQHQQQKEAEPDVKVQQVKKERGARSHHEAESPTMEDERRNSI